MPGSVAVIVDGPDRAAIVAGLREAGIKGEESDTAALALAIARGDGVAILDETALRGRDWAPVEKELGQRPFCFNVPMVLLIDRAAVAELEPNIARLGNVTLSEAPLDMPMLLHSLKMALGQRPAQNVADANRQLREEVEERRRVEQDLRESEELYRYTIELTDQLAWTASPDLRLLTISRGLKGLTEPGRNTDLHDGWSELVHADDLDALMGAWTRARESKKSAEAVFRMRVPGGGYRYFRARAAPRFDEHGQIIRWYGFTEDIQDRIDAEGALHEAEQRYRLAAMATNNAIWEYLPSRATIRWAQTASSVLGYAGELGETDFAWWSERLHPDDRAHAVTSLDTALAGSEERWSSTYRFRRADGEYRRYVDRGFIVRDPRGAPLQVVGAMSDVTQQQAAQEELSRMQAELIHVSRLSAMGTMASTLAHELNQPLTVVTNYMRGVRRLIDMDAVDMDELRHALGLAESGALRAGQIVRRLRELVARGNAAIRPEELPKLIEDAGVIAFVDAHFVGVMPRIELDPEAQWVEADRIQVQQVIINIVRNAIEAMRGSERREIVVRTLRIAPEEAQIDIEDSGPGISPRVRDALFSPFNTTKTDGLGIGLSISRTIIEAHGGKIWASDRIGGGTVFSFTLPAIDPPD